MAKHWTQGFAEAVNDIRQKVLEEGFWGRVVTPKSQTFTIGSSGEQSPGEQLGWWRRDERQQHPPTLDHDREQAAKERPAADRGIDL